MSQCFLELYEYSGGNVKVKLDLFGYPTKADLKEVTGFGPSELAAKNSSK